MNSFIPLLITVFLGLLNIIGGMAVGQGIRALLRGSGHFMPALVWGGFLGWLSLLLDWVLLVGHGHLLYGMLSPLLLLGSAAAAVGLQVKVDGAAVISAIFGWLLVFVGLFSVPVVIDRLASSDSSLKDYVLAGGFILFWVVIGGVLAWKGFTATLHGVSLDRKFARRH